MKSICTIFLAFTCFSSTFAQETKPEAPFVKRIITAVSVASGAISLDGKLDDKAWETAPWNGDFKVWEPNNGDESTFKTQFRVVYDEKYLYIGYKCFDSAPDSIIKRMARRDEFPGDWMEVNIDSYHDQRTAFSFTMSASGVRGDEYITDNGNNWDSNWNPIWDGATQIDAEGWTAEIKIPFSQLRYGNQQEPVWGMQVQRLLFRKGERSTFSNFKQDGSGWVSRMAEVHGLKNLPKNKGVELAPYTVLKAERFEKEEGNPFADGSRNTATVGLDGKLAVTRDLILDFTINPDFGQVEADPGAVRLDGFQNFFSERRPFFLESRNLFDVSVGGDDEGGGGTLFYSRRVGGQPHNYPSLNSGEYADQPQATSILAATKFSGKTKKGLSIGILESVTQREFAKIDLNGTRRKELVEPLTNYFVGRVTQDFKEGNTILGGILTAVNREKGIDWLHRSAYSGGLDLRHSWKNRWWNINASLYGSHVTGTKEAIAETQTGFGHYFQRPTASHVEFDPNRTSLTGTAGNFTIAKWGGKQDSLGGILKYSLNVNWRSPEFEVNDIGFMQTADELSETAWMGYQIQKPGKFYRTMRFNMSNFNTWDLSGRHLFTFYNANAHINTLNQWECGMGINYNPYDVNNNALRGGSALRRPAGWGTWQYFNSDQRKKLRVYGNTWFFNGFENTVKGRSISVGINAQPMNALSISIGPDYNYGWRRQDQYVSDASFGSEDRTIVSEVEERGFSLTSRVTYNLTPDFTLQFYGQPFIYRAKYKNYGYVTNPLAAKYDDRFHAYTNSEISYDENNETFFIDENSDGATDYNFGKPDFNYIQFRSNLVLRWEYIPGSEFYLVWSQGATPDAYNDLDSPLVNSLFSNVFSKKPQNIFLAKATYRFLR
jgi:Domain of unknown function (DUF5916)/Carbohydrate family 9 binding domain-like